MLSGAVGRCYDGPGAGYGWREGEGCLACCVSGRRLLGCVPGCIASITNPSCTAAPWLQLRRREMYGPHFEEKPFTIETVTIEQIMETKEEGEGCAAAPEEA